MSAWGRDVVALLAQAATPMPPTWELAVLALAVSGLFGIFVKFVLDTIKTNHESAEKRVSEHRENCTGRLGDMKEDRDDWKEQSKAITLQLGENTEVLARSTDALEHQTDTLADVARKLDVLVGVAGQIDVRISAIEQGASRPSTRRPSP